LTCKDAFICVRHAPGSIYGRKECRMWLMTKYGSFSIVQKLPMVMDKDGKQGKVFDALEWLAAKGSDVLNKAEQMVHYYGYYSNVFRGRRREGMKKNGYPTSWNWKAHPKNTQNNWASLLLPSRNLRFLDMAPGNDL